MYCPHDIWRNFAGYSFSRKADFDGAAAAGKPNAADEQIDKEVSLNIMQTVQWYYLFDYMNPAFWRFDMAHLDSG